INLGGTLVAHEALKSGAIDLYPEYTGTGLNAVMKAQGVTETDPEKVRGMVKAFYEKEFNLTWLKPSGINNGYAIAVRPETAKEYNLKTLSDLGKVAGKLRLGAGTEFVDRRDGIKGLEEVYGIKFAEFKQFAALRLRYEALNQKQIEVANGFSTDWQIAADKFVALDDDKALFPPYFLAPVVRPEIAANAKIVAILEKIGAALDNPTMQELNRQVEVDKKEPRTVAAAFLKAKGLVN
ncbi:MAG: ABC transporter, partial [Beijerinckiaceae bacterium]|nr:ABC transporter [Beijerinckiaceae bacterium]